jgi:hypothetical protein
MVLHRGYRITIDPQSSQWLVLMSPLYPWLPILGKPEFTWAGSEEDALLEAMHRIDDLLIRTM